MGIGNYKLASKDDLKILRESTTHCELTGKPIENGVVDHIHLNESDTQGLNPDWDGKIRGVISNSSNLALGFIMKESRELNMTPNEYLVKIQEYLNRKPTDLVYPSYPKEVKDYFATLSIDDKQEYLDYHFGINTTSTNDESLNRMLKNALADKFR